MFRVCSQSLLNSIRVCCCVVFPVPILFQWFLLGFCFALLENAFDSNLVRPCERLVPAFVGWAEGHPRSNRFLNHSHEQLFPCLGCAQLCRSLCFDGFCSDFVVRCSQMLSVPIWCAPMDGAVLLKGSSHLCCGLSVACPKCLPQFTSLYCSLFGAGGGQSP